MNSTSSIKERPLILKTEMVQAILEGRKTQTRSVVAPSLKNSDPQFELHQEEDGSWTPMHTFNEDLFDSKGVAHPIKCPLGSIGDRIWIRETWQGPLVDYDEAYSMFKDPTPYNKVENCVYRADGGEYPEFTDSDDEVIQGWKSSSNMPRWASRITLEIVDIRVEQLNSISAEDITEEGVKTRGEAMWGCRWWLGAPEEAVNDARELFAKFWNETHRDNKWDDNPWVWVVEFKRLDYVEEKDY